MKTRIDNWFNNWVSRQIPASHEVELNQRRIFVFPTKAGMLYLSLIGLLVLTAINYQNNAVYALAFLLAGQFVVAILASYSNLAGLKLRRGVPSPGYAGDRVTFRIVLARKKNKQYYAIRVGWPGSYMGEIHLDVQTESTLEIYHLAPRRGVLKPGRILIETFYPLGLVRAWSWLDLQLQSDVYPKPLPCRPMPISQSESGVGHSTAQTQQDEFNNIRPWRQFDPPRQILWKAYAKQQPLMTMEFTESVLSEVWIDDSLLAGKGLEERLSYVCHTVLQLAQQDVQYGLRLGTLRIEPGKGEEHRQKILKTLARYPAGATRYE